MNLEGVSVLLGELLLPFSDYSLIFYPQINYAVKKNSIFFATGGDDINSTRYFSAIGRSRVWNSPELPSERFPSDTHSENLCSKIEDPRNLGHGLSTGSEKANICAREELLQTKKLHQHSQKRRSRFFVRTLAVKSQGNSPSGGFASKKGDCKSQGQILEGTLAAQIDATNADFSGG